MLGISQKWAEDDVSYWYQGQGSVMREILTEDGCKCQSQEDKGSHAAEVAEGNQMEAEEVTFCCLPNPLECCLICCQEFLPQE